MRTDLPGAESGDVLDLLDDATARLCALAAELDDDAVSAPSALAGWARGQVLAHLAYGARASARMTSAALAGRASAFYPGGTAEREASIARGTRLPARELVEDLRAGATELAAVWRALPARSWDVPLRADAFPGASVARLLLLRLTEVELHTSDLALGTAPWDPAFAPLALPYRLAWLPVHHRARADADRSVRGRWSFHAGSRAWLVSADGDVCEVAALPAGQGDVAFSGTERDLLAFVLGRAGVDEVDVRGDRALAASFKAAFPGP